jgi:hypothetical protein
MCIMKVNVKCSLISVDRQNSVKRKITHNPWRTKLSSRLSLAQSVRAFQHTSKYNREEPVTVLAGVILAIKLEEQERS